MSITVYSNRTPFSPLALINAILEIAGTTQYFNEIQNNGNSEKRHHFIPDSTFRLDFHNWNLVETRRVTIVVYFNIILVFVVINLLFLSKIKVPSFIQWFFCWLSSITQAMAWESCDLLCWLLVQTRKLESFDSQLGELQINLRDVL